MSALNASTTQSRYFHANGFSWSRSYPLVSAYLAKSSQCRAQRCPNIGEASSRSTARRQASGRPSLIKRPNSARDGGNPTKSECNRRKSVRRSALGARLIPCRSNRAITNASIGLLGGCRPASLGITGLTTGCSDHQSRPARTSLVRSNQSSSLLSGHGAPAEIHCSSSSLSFSGSR